MGKRRIKCLLLIAYLGMCFPTHSQIRLLGSYGGSWDESFPKIISGTNNTILLAGSTQSFPHNDTFPASPDFYSIVIDTSGQMIWDDYHGHPSESDYINGVINTFDNSYLFVGAALYQGGWGFGDTRILKLDDQGEIVYSKLLGMLLPNFANDVCKTLDSNYVIAGACTQGGNSFPLLIKINEDGDTLWTRTYPQDSIGYVLNIIPAQDGGFFCTTYEIGSSYPILLKYSSTGQVEWTKKFSELGSEYVDVNMIYGLCEGSEPGTFWTLVDGFSSLGPNPMCGNFNEFLHLVEFNQGGEVVRKKTFCGTDTSSNNFRCLAQTSDGGVLLAGIGIIQKLNADWEEEWFLETSYNIQNVMEHSDGYFYATGEVVTTNSDFFLLKIFPDGTNSIELLPGKKEISVFPNPANDYLSIDLNSTKPWYYSVLDTKGSVHLMGSSNQKKEIDISHLAEGLYFIQIQVDSKFLVEKIIID
jgi:hypothetical protein